MRRPRSKARVGHAQERGEMRIVLRGRELGLSGSAKNQGGVERVGSLLGSKALAYGVKLPFYNYCFGYFHINDM